MSYTHYQRLSGLDTIFLDLEGPNVHMHVGSVAIFDDRPDLRTPEGALDIDRIRTYIAGSLGAAPRFRQRLATIPLLNHPVWVDDRRFKIRYHVRHTALPAPGGLRQLKRLAGRIMSQQLDRAKPMWEMWVVEGLADDRFALIIKAHHCMVDGISGIDLLAAILSQEPEAAEQHAAKTWIPRPRPYGAELLLDETMRRASLPARIAGSIPELVMRPIRSLSALRESVLGITEAIRAGMVSTTSNPLNPDIGPYRKFDWTEFDIAKIKAVRKKFGGTLNDVVLATAAGAVGRFLEGRGEVISSQTVFRAMIPVSTQKVTNVMNPGNHVVNYFAELPIHERDPKKRLAKVTATMSQLKNSRLAAGSEALEGAIDLTFSSLLADLAQLATRNRAYNIVITNVPGPPIEIYFMGAPMRSIYPVVPLFTNQALGIALFGYNGKLCWGFNADWDAVPDLHDFVLLIDEEFRTLCDMADVNATLAGREYPREVSVADVSNA